MPNNPDGGRQVPVPSMNPQAQSHEALKAMTDAADPAAAQAVADGWTELGTGFTEAADLFRRTMADSEAGWTGEAADAMRARLAEVARWSEQTGEQYRAAGAAITDQVGAADTAKTTMPPPVPYNPAQMIRDARESGNIFELAALPHQLYAQKQRHDAAHEQAAEIVANRDRTFASAAGGVPAFIPPPSLAEGATPEAARVVETPAPTLPPPPRTHGERPRHPHAGPSPTGAQGTSPAGFTGGPAGPIPGRPGFAGPTGQVGPVGPAQGFAPGPGFGPATGFGPGGPTASAGRLAPVPRGPAAATPAAGTEEAAQKRPEYLIEPEIEGMFGSDELTAPPVIGE